MATCSTRPVAELGRLRGPRMASLADVSLNSAPRKLDGCRGDSLEIVAQVALGEAKSWGLRLRASGDGKHSIPIEFDGRILDVAGAKTPLQVPQGETSLGLHVFLDRSVLEVYTSTGVGLSRVIAPRPGHMDVEAFASGGSATIRTLEVWPISSIWDESGRK